MGNLLRISCNRLNNALYKLQAGNRLVLEFIGDYYCWVCFAHVAGESEKIKKANPISETGLLLIPAEREDIN